MTKAELIARAFGFGLAQGLTANAATDLKEPEASALPPVIPMESIKAAVREVLEPLIAEDEARAPTGDQLDMFTHNIEDVDPDGDAERIRLRVEEARQRAVEAAEQERVRPGEFDPNAPQTSPWMTPRRTDE